ncbi:MAG: MFS transporter [Rickettsia endosymbiont of Pseudomimeciton antennatum]|nr:MFS transporter [Rickettsia endosymbiont of Pseudomimeciton antennatum]MCC8398235.1 MFS transporter [Rickettsia endosymbiont of Labidopullus appendiculatus]
MSELVQENTRIIPNHHTNLTREQKEALGLLSIGTFLEYFDLMLYVHMAAFLNELFFEPTDPHTTSLMMAFAFCTTFIFRPIGAIIFGRLGDNIGRKSTVIITTFMMATSCLVMANLPTYAQIGVTATWIVTICRIVQGMSSMGERVGAELYLTETTKPPTQYATVAFIGACSSIGGLGALGVASLVTSHGFNWRLAFWLGAVVALIGSVARTRLRETPEFADAKRRVKKVFENTNTDTANLINHPMWQEKVNKKTVIALLLLQCAEPVCFYFTYVHCGTILKANFDYTTAEVIHHNFIIQIIKLLIVLIAAYLSYKIYPLLIVKVTLIICSIFIIFCPYLLNNINAPYQLFLIQFVIILFEECLVTAGPIFYKRFPVFKRFTYVGIVRAVSRAFTYVITTFAFTYVTNHFGNWGLLFIMIPTIIGFAYGLFHFEKLTKEAGNLPHSHRKLVS